MQTEARKRNGILLPHLAAHRESQFLSQADLAARSGVSRSAIGDAEKGKPIRPGNARKLADALNMTPKQLLSAPEGAGSRSA